MHVGDDGWAIYAQDDSPTAHFEFTVAITAEGPRILTPWHIPAAEREAAAAAASTGHADDAPNRLLLLCSVLPAGGPFGLPGGMSSTW